MTELPGSHGESLQLRPIHIVPQAVADEMIREALETIGALEQELQEAARMTTRLDERLDAEADFLIEQARAVVAEAEEHRAKVLAAARAEATVTIDAAPATRNGKR